MKSIFIILTFLYFMPSSQAQQVPFKEILVGKYLEIDKPIKGIEYTFSDRIHQIYYDSLHQNITAQLRGVKNEKWLSNKGNVLVVNLTTQKTLWSEKMNYVGQSIIQSDNLIIKNRGKSELLNPENGTPLWSNSSSVFYLNQKNHVALGYGTKANRLYNIDLSNGSDLWHREIKTDYGWNGINYLNDSTLLVLASGVHTINLKNGRGWDFDMVTGEKDYTATALTNVAGAVLGILTGSFFYASGHNTVSELASNAILKDDKIYFASKQKLACLNMDGKPLWLTAIPKDTMSKSLIFVKDSTLYMVNYGYAFMGEKQISFGSPFIAAFNLNTGNKIYSQNISSIKSILDFKLYDNEIALLANDKLIKYEFQTGKMMSNKSFDSDQYGGLMGFVGSQVFEKKNDDTFQSLVFSDNSNIVVSTKKNTIVTLDKELNPINQRDVKEFYIKYKQLSNASFLIKGNEIILLDKNNKTKAILRGQYNPLFSSSKLFLTNENRLIEINLDDLND